MQDHAARVRRAHPDDAEYVATGIDSCGAEVEPDAGVDERFIETGVLPFEPEGPTRSIDERVGFAILRLRVYRGLSQMKLERISGVDQTTISRLENAKCRGLHIRRLFAILKALRADEITFGPGPRKVPQSSWEDAMYGDMWERAGRVAEARVRRSLNRRRSA